LKWVLASGERVIRERCIGAHKNIVFDRDVVPELNTAFNRDSIADLDIVLDECVIANITVAANLSAREYVAERPDTSTVAD
jgi:hypothetical protein